MENNWDFVLKALTILFGFASAFSWLYASRVKVSREAMLAKRKKQEERDGLPLGMAGVSFDGWDMSATFAAQSKWNSIGAFCAALSISAQTASTTSF